jgi:hypothetical protein
MEVRMEKQKNKRVRKESQKAKRERISVENRLARLIGKDADFKENPGNIFEVPLQEVLLATIRVDTPWLRKAIESFNFNVSLNDLKRRSDLFIDKVEASRKSDRHEENMFFHGVKAKVERLVDIYIDASQELNGNRKSAIFEKGQLASPDTRYWKSLLRLNSVLGSLGIRDETEIRMYIKGVSLKKGIKYKMVPIMTLGSHFCVLDFLIFLKEVWYERHATSKHESLYRWRDFGQSYYLKTANQALGLLKSNIECNRGSVFSADF